METAITIPTLADFRRDSNPVLYGRGKTRKYKFYYGYKDNRYQFVILPFGNYHIGDDNPQGCKEKSLRQSYELICAHLRYETLDMDNDGQSFEHPSLEGYIRVGEFKISLSY